MEKNKTESLLALRDKYQNSIGWKIHGKIKNLYYYKSFFDSNFLDLLKKIYKYKSNLSYYWAIKSDGSRNLDEFISELARYLHNYLMSLFSLKDKTIALRNHLIKKFELKLPEIEYQSKLKEYMVDEHYEFLIKLRHSFTHGIEQEGLDQLTFRLDGKDNSGHIIIENKKVEKLITEYKESTDKFYDWFFETLKTFYSKDIDQTNQLIKEENRIFGVNYEKAGSKKGMNCWKCKKQIVSNKIIGLLDENENLLGYICESCEKQHIENKTQKLRCSECNNLFTDVEMKAYSSINNNHNIAELFYKCNKCGFEGNVSLIIGLREYKVRGNKKKL